MRSNGDRRVKKVNMKKAIICILIFLMLLIPVYGDFNMSLEIKGRYGMNSDFEEQKFALNDDNELNKELPLLENTKLSDEAARKTIAGYYFLTKSICTLTELAIWYFLGMVCMFSAIGTHDPEVESGNLCDECFAIVVGGAVSFSILTPLVPILVLRKHDPNGPYFKMAWQSILLEIGVNAGTIYLFSLDTRAGILGLMAAFAVVPTFIYKSYIAYKPVENQSNELRFYPPSVRFTSTEFSDGSHELTMKMNLIDIRF